LKLTSYSLAGKLFGFLIVESATDQQEQQRPKINLSLSMGVKFENPQQVLTCVRVAIFAILCSQLLPWGVGFPACDDAVNPNSSRIGPATYNSLFKTVLVGSPPDSSFPLIVQPRVGFNASVDAAIAWVAANNNWLRARYYEHGAVVFRGWKIATAHEFERVATACVSPSPLFGGTYLGTSPRLSAVDGTKFVYTASELPGWQVVPVHFEMSFRSKGMPQEILFWAETPNQSEGGETPLVDFRQVWRELQPDVALRFEKRGIRYLRQYFSEQRGGANSVMPWSLHPSFLKAWEKMFQTNNRSLAKERAEEQGFKVQWLHGDANMMRLEHTMPALRSHPVTGEPTWSNHLAVIHPSCWVDEFAYTAHRTDISLFWALRAVASYAYMWVCNSVVELALGHEGMGMQATYIDGGRIPAADVRHLREVIWRNSFTSSWQLGDVAWVDNNRIAHGRQAFEGSRRLLVSWTQ
jgi:alpha-ketoglutarate-dependent taurine dioxygenase